MKAKIESKKFKNLLEAVMVSGEIDPITIDMKEKVCVAVNVTESSILASIIVAKTDYFDEYESKGEELVFGKEVADRLKWGFKDNLTITTKNNKMRLSDGADKLPVELEDSLDREFPIPITKTQYGLLADYNLYKAEDGKDWNEEKALKNYNIYKVDAKNLNFPGNVTNYKFNSKDAKLSILIDGVSTSYEHDIESEYIAGNDISIVISATLFKKIVSNLEGSVVLIFDDSSITFLIKGSLCKTFCLATKDE